jgi:hypothetical protein
MRRVVLVLALVTGSLIGFGVPVSGLGLISVTLTCSDGTSVTMNVDTDTLNSLTDSVNAMALYPAGLTCTLVQNPVNPLGAFFGHVATAASGNTFLVGGGRWQVPCSTFVGPPPPPPPAPAPPPPAGIAGGVVAHVPAGALAYPIDFSPQLPDPTEVFIWVNIAVNAHLSSDQTIPNSAYGSLNETIPANQGPCPGKTGDVQVGESHFSSKVTTLTVNNNATPPIACVTSQVTQASDGSGQVPFRFPGGTVAVPDVVQFGFQDGGFPPGQATASTSDMLNGPPASPEGSANCTPALTPPPFYHLGTNDPSIDFKQYGNLTLHQ